MRRTLSTRSSSGLLFPESPISHVQPTPELDLTSCDREPIHIPGSIQPHGALLAVGPDLTIVQASTNTDRVLGKPAEEILGLPLDSLTGPVAAREVRTRSASPGLDATAQRVEIDGRTFQMLALTNEAGWILEFEPEEFGVTRSFGFYSELQKAIAEMREATNVRQLVGIIAREVRRITGFDRVMVYRFLEDESGVVIAEDMRDDLDPYFDHHYPASDIPKQARALYLRKWIRTIHDVEYVPVPITPEINPVTGRPLDMSGCALRSVSPIHIQYLKNMEVGASMSVSLVRGERLWGLIACHHEVPWYGGHELRSACELLGQIASLQIATLEDKEERDARSRNDALRQRLIAAMVEHRDVFTGLQSVPSDLLDLVGASGAAFVNDGAVVLIGATPREAQVRELAKWAVEWCASEPYATDTVSKEHPEALAYTAVASGVLSICHDRQNGGVLLWFRPEVVQTVTWAGDPIKPATEDGEGLRPRTSFAAWQETVRGRSKPWSRSDVRAAADLRISIIEIEISSLNAELERRVAERTEALQKAVDELNGFTYSVSHDLRTPLRGMIGNSRILIEEHATNLDRDVRAGLMRIETAALKMSALVDSLLQFARLGRQDMRREPVDLSRIGQEVAKKLQDYGWPCEDGQIEVQPGLRAFGDPELLEVVLTTLLDNGCKYRHSDQRPSVQFGQTVTDRGVAFFVRNEGIGFDMRYLHKLFEPFQRLHRDADFPGTGIGLANARRIVERHGGQMWAESEVGAGATFYFTLPSDR